MADLFGQGDFAVRLDWGPAGARATRPDVAVVVDVLSFSTAVTVAVERGMQVYPYRWKGPRAAEFARENDAVVAVGRLEASRDSDQDLPTLSPAGLLTGPVFPRLVLPSPNGSTIAAALAEVGTTVVAGCLRNARAVAQWLVQASAQVQGHGLGHGLGQVVTVVAAGERWADDDSLRPALKDHLGAGAILSALRELVGDDGFSPEALAAAQMFDAGRQVLTDRLHGCVSGLELHSRGFGADVDVAADLDRSSVVPVLVDGAFVERGAEAGSGPGRSTR